MAAPHLIQLSLMTLKPTSGDQPKVDSKIFEANILMRDPRYLESREVFVGKILEGAEQLYDELLEKGYIKQE